MTKPRSALFHTTSGHCRVDRCLLTDITADGHPRRSAAGDLGQILSSRRNCCESMSRLLRKLTMQRSSHITKMSNINCFVLPTDRQL
jgi:hypothetical protein